MTARRFSNYATARSLIDSVDDGWVGPGPIELLRDVSEAMLLSRDGTRDRLEGELDEVARVLRQLIDAGALDIEAGIRLWRVILASGPPGRGRADDVLAAEPS